MKPVYISGRGLACALGLNVNDSLSKLRLGNAATTSCVLPGMTGGAFPYYSIPYLQDDWNLRACEIMRRVVAEAMGRQSRNGVLFIATSSYDIGAEDEGATQREYSAFTRKVAAWLEWTGPVYVINTACTSSLNALIAAHALLQEGDAEEALVLGVELHNRLTLGGFAALQLLSRGSCKPFGLQRDGLVLGEAVAALRLSAKVASPWKILGGANVVEGSQPTGASAPAVVSMYQRALASCGLSADAIDLIKVQAAGSPGNDAVEAQGLRAAFERLPALVSLKAAMGHTMGASGVAEIALLSACLEQGVCPEPTADPDLSLGVALAGELPQQVRYLMATILGFGGSHATVVLEHT